MSLATYDQLVAAIYDAGVDTRKWTDFLSLLSRSFGSARVGIHCHDHFSDINLGTLQSGFDQSYIDLYNREYAPLSPWAKAQARASVCEAQTSEMLVPRDSLRKTAFYNDWVRPQEDIGTGAGITIYKSPTRLLRLSCNIRFRDEEKYQAKLVACLNLIAPHVERAFRICRRLRGIEVGDKLAASFEHLPTAVFLLGPDGHVHYANRAAERLQRDEALLAHDRTGRLEFKDSAASLALSDALSCIANREHGRLRGDFTVRRNEEGATMRATIAPFQPAPDREGDLFDSLDQSGPIAIATLHAPSRQHAPSPSDLARLHGLTHAEATLALQLFQGSNLRTHAATKGISIHTARKQLSMIFDKTGCSQQSQLVALLARSC